MTLSDEERRKKLSALPNATSFDEVCQYLVTQALFGDPVNVVDGWLILTPHWWDDLLSPYSPIIDLLRFGHLSLFIRSKDGRISTVMDEMADKVGTYGKLRDDPRYPAFRQSIKQLEDEPGSYRFVRWPDRDMDADYDVSLNTTLSRIRRYHTYPASSAQLDAIHEQFQFKRHHDQMSGRAAWTSAATELIDDLQLDAIQFKAIYHVGVEAYHRSRAEFLQDKVFQMKNDIRQRTSTVISSVSDTEDIPIVDPRALTDRMIQLSVDWKLIRDQAKGRLESGKQSHRVWSILEAVAFGGPLYHLKREYIRHRDLATTDYPTYRNNYHEATAAYVNAVNKYFQVTINVSESARKISQFRTIIGRSGVKLTIDAFGFLVTSLTPGGQAMATKMGISAGSTILANVSEQFSPAVYNRYLLAEDLSPNLVRIKETWERGRLPEASVSRIDPYSSSATLVVPTSWKSR